MGIDRQAILNELADWFIEHRKPLTARSMKPILKRHLTAEAEYLELIDYLSSKAGIANFSLTVKSKLRNLSR